MEALRWTTLVVYSIVYIQVLKENRILKYEFWIYEHEGASLSLASIWNVRSNHPKDTQTALHRSNIFPLQFWTETNSVIQISDIYVAATGGKTSQQILYGYICSSRKKVAPRIFRHYTCLQLETKANHPAIDSWTPVTAYMDIWRAAAEKTLLSSRDDI
jgi:hypothetical protein